jgi:hypothetical protein
MNIQKQIKMLSRFLHDFLKWLDLEIIRKKMRNICDGSGVSKNSSIAYRPFWRDAEISILSTLWAQIPAGANLMTFGAFTWTLLMN